MKKIALALLAALIIPTAALAAGKEIKVGVTPFPHKDIMNVVKQLVAKEGYDLKIVEFTDYVTPNTALAEKALDANFFQHVPYLENTNKEKGYDLAWVAKIHIEPLGLYSKKIKKIGELKKGAQVAIPNDATNCARALRLLEKSGLIKVKAGELVTAKDVTENPKNLDIQEIAAEQLPRSLADVDLAVINGNYALQADLNAAEDSLITENPDYAKVYVNVVACRSGEENSDKIQALKKALQSDDVKKYVDETYKGAVVTVF